MQAPSEHLIEFSQDKIHPFSPHFSPAHWELNRRSYACPAERDERTATGYSLWGTEVEKAKVERGTVRVRHEDKREKRG